MSDYEDKIAPLPEGEDTLKKEPLDPIKKIIEGSTPISGDLGAGDFADKVRKNRKPNQLG